MMYIPGVFNHTNSGERRGGMESGKKKEKKQEKQEDPMKLEIAAELGLLDKVRMEGWGSLSAKETGRIGGLLAMRRKERRQEASGSSERDGLS